MLNIVRTLKLDQRLSWASDTSHNLQHVNTSSEESSAIKTVASRSCTP